HALLRVSTPAACFGGIHCAPPAAAEPGCSSVSLTPSAPAPPVLIGIVRPPPGSETPREADMMIDSLTALAQISDEISFGRRSETPLEVRLRSIPAITGSYS